MNSQEFQLLIFMLIVLGGFGVWATLKSLNSPTTLSANPKKHSAKREKRLRKEQGEWSTE
jgi:hypothetical protein